MPKLSEEEARDLLKDVVWVNGPKVIFTWGCKVVVFKGEKVLEPLTPDEYRALYKAETGKDFPPNERPQCVYSMGVCQSVKCQGVCVLITGGSGGVMSCKCEQ